MEKYFKKIYCTEVGKNPEHRYPTGEAPYFYKTNYAIELRFCVPDWGGEKVWWDGEQECNPKWWLEEVELSMPVYNPLEIQEYEKEGLAYCKWRNKDDQRCSLFVPREVLEEYHKSKFNPSPKKEVEIKWVNVKDKLPKENETVLTWWSSNKFCDITDEWRDDYVERYGITHWMPLPEAPIQ